MDTALGRCYTDAIVPASSPTPTGVLLPERRAELRTITKEIADTPEIEARARKRLTGFADEEVVAFITESWPTLQRRQRRELWLLYAFVGVAVFCSLSWWFSVVPLAHRWGNYYGQKIACLLNIPLFSMRLIKGVVSHRSQEYRGLAEMLPAYRDNRLVPFMVDALPGYIRRDHLRVTLTQLLPCHHLMDAPALNERQQRTLLGELWRLCRRAKRPERLSDADAAYLAAILHYFQNDAAYGRSTLRNLEPLVAQVAQSAVNTEPNITRRWTHVQQAAEDCLVRIKASNEA